LKASHSGGYNSRNPIGNHWAGISRVQWMFREYSNC